MSEVTVYFLNGPKPLSLVDAAANKKGTGIHGAGSLLHGLTVESHRLRQLLGQNALRIFADPPAGQLPLFGQGGAGVDQLAVFDDVAEPVGVSELGNVGLGLAIKNQDVGKIIGFDAAQLAFQLERPGALFGGAVIACKGVIPRSSTKT